MEELIKKVEKEIRPQFEENEEIERINSEKVLNRATPTEIIMIPNKTLAAIIKALDAFSISSLLVNTFWYS